MTINEMKQRKIELGLSNEMLAEASGVPLSTIQKIFCGATKAPRKATIDALEKVLKKRAYTYPEEKLFDDNSGNGMLRESLPAYNKNRQGTFTLDDYYALPDDRRFELIDGVIYDMSTPTLTHQLIIGDVYRQLDECAEEHDGACTVILSPSDVQLDKDERTMLQPDIYVFCGEADLKKRSFYGAPDMTVEVLSPSTRSKDMMLKLHKYHNAGVREYWIIDSENRKIMVYDFSDESFYPEIHNFNDIVPVKISGGTCSVDFGRVSRKVFKE